MNPSKDPLATRVAKLEDQVTYLLSAALEIQNQRLEESKHRKIGDALAFVAWIFLFCTVAWIAVMR